MISDLLRTGLNHIECGAFVSPKWVPQMADSLKVFENIKVPENSNPILSALVPNMKGL